MDEDCKDISIVVSPRINSLKLKGYYKSGNQKQITSKQQQEIKSWQNTQQKYYHKPMDREAGLAHQNHRTKIVATVGPACDTYDKLLELVKAGVNVFRLNFSHGSHEDKTKIIEHIRKINKTEPYNIAILGDLQGPKLRVGEIQNGQIEIVPGEILTFTNEKVIGTKERIYVSYPNLHEDVMIGNTIMINDGKLEVKVKKVLKNNDVQVEVTMGGILIFQERDQPA